ncbi:hypothetical protein ACOME3_009535 [Neoechinorhynchus agilis]
MPQMLQLLRKSLGGQGKRAQNEEAAGLGNELFALGNFAEANLAYTEALKTHGEYANLFVNRALCKLMLGEWNEVISDSKRAIEIDNQSIKGHFFLGLGYLEKAELDEAVHHLREARYLSEKSLVLYMDDPIERALRRAFYTQWQLRNGKDSISAKEKEIPEYLACQICMDILQDPVITPSGLTYCRRCITQWFLL